VDHQVRGLGRRDLPGGGLTGLLLGALGHLAALGRDVAGAAGTITRPTGRRSPAGHVIGHLLCQSRVPVDGSWATPGLHIRASGGIRGRGSARFLKAACADLPQGDATVRLRRDRRGTRARWEKHGWAAWSPTTCSARNAPGRDLWGGGGAVRGGDGSPRAVDLSDAGGTWTRRVYWTALVPPAQLLIVRRPTGPINSVS